MARCWHLRGEILLINILDVFDDQHLRNTLKISEVGAVKINISAITFNIPLTDSSIGEKYNTYKNCCANWTSGTGKLDLQTKSESTKS